MPPTPDPINKLSVAQIYERIRRWTELSASGISVDALIPEVRNLCGQILFETLQMPGDVKFYRARVAEDHLYFDNISALWHPPKHAVRTLGRANRQESPVLYLAQDGRTALFETHPAIGQNVGIAEIRLRPGETLNLQHVGVLGNLTSGNFSAVSKKWDKRLKGLGLTRNGIRNVKLIHNLLAKEFMRDVAVGRPQDYVVSVAIAEFFLSYARTDGLLFPSKRSPNDFNIVVKADSADNKLRVDRVYGVEVVDNSPGAMSFKYQNASTFIDSNGVISWATGSILPPLDWNSAGHPALRGPFKELVQNASK